MGKCPPHKLLTCAETPARQCQKCGTWFALEEPEILDAETDAVTKSEAWKIARDAYMKGEEDAALRDERPSYEDRVMDAEHVARVLTDIATTPQQGGEG